MDEPLSPGEARELLELLRVQRGRRGAAVDITIARHLEMEAMMVQGQRLAEAAQLSAGFMGGDSPTAIAWWLFFSGLLFVMFCDGVAKSIALGRAGQHMLELHQALNASTALLTSLSCALRGTLMWARQAYASYFALVFSLAPIGFLMICWSILSLRVYTFNGQYATTHQRVLDVVYRTAFSFCGSIMIVGSVLMKMRRRKSVEAIMHACLTVGTVGVASVAVAQLSNRSCTHCTISTGAGNGTCAAFLAGAFFTILKKRREYARRAQAIIAQDKRRYDAEWQTIIKGPDAPSIAKELDSLALSLSALSFHLVGRPSGHNAARQEQCAAATAAASSRVIPLESKDNDDSTSNRRHTPKQLQRSVRALEDAMRVAYDKTRLRQAISSLPMLHGQATLLNPHFQAKVSAFGEGLACTVHNVDVKDKDRAIEKLYRTYYGDASRLLDLVRALISFESLDDMRLCLKRIQDDPSVGIVGFKNRFRLDFDSASSGGYRNVALSLVVADDVTVADGTSRHICELQLGLRRLDALRSDDGHRNYVRWRDEIAE